MNVQTTQPNTTSVTAETVHPNGKFNKLKNGVILTVSFTMSTSAGLDILESALERQNMSGAAAFVANCLRTAPNTPTFARPLAAVYGAGAQLSAGISDTVFGPSKTVRSMTCS